MSHRAAHGVKTVPTYEYRREANGRLVEVRHDMAERLATRSGEPAGAGPDCGIGD
jgi:predicted nucleic acid-binding Zn ribbon protein